MHSYIFYKLSSFFVLSGLAVAIMGSEEKTLLPSLLKDNDFARSFSKLHKKAIEDNAAAFEVESGFREETDRFIRACGGGFIGTPFAKACKDNNRAEIEKGTKTWESKFIGFCVKALYPELNNESKAYIASAVPYALWHALNDEFIKGDSEKINELYTYLNDGFMVPFVALGKNGSVVPILHYIVAKGFCSKRVSADALEGYFNRVKQLVQVGFNTHYTFNYISTNHVTPSDGAMPDPNMQEALGICVMKYDAYTWTKKFVTSEKHKTRLMEIFKTHDVQKGTQKAETDKHNTVDMFLPGTQFCCLKAKFREAFVYATHRDCDQEGANIKSLKKVVSDPKIPFQCIVDVIEQCAEKGSTKQRGTVPVGRLRNVLQAIGDVRPEVASYGKALFNRLTLED